MDLYWFSGSGNTLRAAEVFANRLRSNGWTVRLLPMEKRSAELFDPQAVCCLAFPTYCFSIPLMVRAFLRRLPAVDHTPAVYLGTHGLFSGGVRGHLKGILLKKGFSCIAGRLFRMPDSFFPFCSDRRHQRLIKRTLSKVERFADRIDAGKRGWFRIPFLSGFAELFCFGFFAARKLSVSTQTTVHPARTKSVLSRQAVDENSKDLSGERNNENTTSDEIGDQCRNCRLCMRFCPVGAISPDENGMPKIPSEKCQNCLRCVAVCPVDRMRHLFFRPYHSESPENFKNRLSSVLNQNNQ